MNQDFPRSRFNGRKRVRTGNVSLVIDLMQGLKISVRSLLKTPGTTFVIILTLGLGIGANTTIFTVLDGLYHRMIPFEDPDGLITPAESFGDGIINITSLPRIEEWRRKGVSCEQITGWRSQRLSLADPDGTDLVLVHVLIVEVAGSIFAVPRRTGVFVQRPVGVIRLMLENL